MEEPFLFLMIEGIDWELTSEPQQQTTTTTMSLQDKLNFPFVKIHFYILKVFPRKPRQKCVHQNLK